VQWSVLSAKALKSWRRTLGQGKYGSSPLTDNPFVLFWKICALKLLISAFLFAHPQNTLARQIRAFVNGISGWVMLQSSTSWSIIIPKASVRKEVSDGMWFKVSTDCRRLANDSSWLHTELQGFSMQLYQVPQWQNQPDQECNTIWCHDLPHTCTHPVFLCRTQSEVTTGRVLATITLPLHKSKPMLGTYSCFTLIILSPRSSAWILAKVKR
jgi:hypothetical protein